MPDVVTVIYCLWIPIEWLSRSCWERLIFLLSVFGPQWKWCVTRSVKNEHNSSRQWNQFKDCNVLCTIYNHSLKKFSALHCYSVLMVAFRSCTSNSVNDFNTTIWVYARFISLYFFCLFSSFKIYKDIFPGKNTHTSERYAAFFI